MHKVEVTGGDRIALNKTAFRTLLMGEKNRVT